MLSGLCWAGTRQQPGGPLGTSFPAVIIFSNAHICWRNVARSVQPYDFLSAVPPRFFPARKERCAFAAAAPGAVRVADSVGGELSFSEWGKKAGGLLAQMLRAAPLAS